jgi:hypothetical protein
MTARVAYAAGRGCEVPILKGKVIALVHGRDRKEDVGEAVGSFM